MGLGRAPDRRGAARDVRALVGWAFVLAVGVAIAFAMTDRTARAQEADDDQLQLGAELYAVNCAACHGPRGEGGPGETGLTAGPEVAGIDVNYIDQQLRTGRMPLIDRTAGVVRPQQVTAEEREAIVAWMNDELGLEGELIEVGEGDVVRGQELYTLNCAACHGSVGNGGIVGRGVTALGLRGIDEVAMVQAIRVGPYQMPAFSEDLLSEEDADDIAAFTTREFADPQRTFLGLTEQNRVGLSAMAVLLLGLILGAAMLVARPVPLPTESGEDGRE